MTEMSINKTLYMSILNNFVTDINQEINTYLIFLFKEIEDIFR